MKSTVSGNSFGLPEALWAEVEAAALDEHRAVDDVLRDLIERGLNERRWKAHAATERERARAVGLPDDEIPVTDEYRRTIRGKIAAGMASLRAGRSVDGDAVFDRLEAELDAADHRGPA